MNLFDDAFCQRSVYFQQVCSHIAFITSDSWVVRSNIEQRIKEKIDSVGVPLKDWNVSINCGIKTGFNDAFIITGNQR